MLEGITLHTVYGLASKFVTRTAVSFGQIFVVSLIQRPHWQRAMHTHQQGPARHTSNPLSLGIATCKDALDDGHLGVMADREF